MLSYVTAIFLGMLQGITELFPVSSLGHSVIAPKLFHLSLNQNAPYFLTFLVATHAATALVLFLFFFSDWKKIIAGFLRSLKNREIHEDDTYAKLAWLLIVGTIPAGLLGVLFEDILKNLFASPQLVAGVLVLNGLLLLTAEQLGKKKNQKSGTEGSDRRIAKLSWKQTLLVGILQCLALIPGFSRTGSAMTGGLLTGLSHEDSGRFAFLLATPIIAGAALVKLPELASDQSSIGPTIVGAVFAGVSAYFSVTFLVKYFQTKTLLLFALYCMIAGLLVSGFFLFR
ncbi:MAG TPA: undecaprenyl-diphosphate phosphatase [Patescibacteria group bacterium]|nr:undecaprenyl-diphosphate phosphatase [Patescibacteria group bacterium]